MALPKNRKAVIAILSEISSRVIGLSPRFFPTLEKVYAAKIIPSGDTYPSEEVLPLLWQVILVNDKKEPQFTVCLDAFIPAEELDMIFRKHFGDIRTETNPYALSISGADRIALNYPPAVRIRDNSDLIEFSFDWGRDQTNAEIVCRSFPGGYLKMHESTDVRNLINILKQINSLILFSGGPTPQYSFESRWMDNYQSALEIATTSKSVALSLGLQSVQGHMYITSTTLTFYK